jgi:hypothetical protein
MDTLLLVRRLHKLYLEKYELSCVYREHEKAIRCNGNLNALEHILIDADEGDLVNQRRAEVEDRRNKLLALWRKLK